MIRKINSLNYVKMLVEDLCILSTRDLLQDLQISVQRILESLQEFSCIPKSQIRQKGLFDSRKNLIKENLVNYVTSCTKFSNGQLGKACISINLIVHNGKTRAGYTDNNLSCSTYNNSNLGGFVI